MKFCTCSPIRGCTVPQIDDLQQDGAPSHIKCTLRSRLQEMISNSCIETYSPRGLPAKVHALAIRDPLIPEGSIESNFYA